MRSEDNIVMVGTQPVAHFSGETCNSRCSFGSDGMETGIFQDREVLSVVELVRLESAYYQIVGIGAYPPTFALAFLNDKSLHSSFILDFGYKDKKSFSFSGKPRTQKCKYNVT